MTVELRVGMSLYWGKLEQYELGWVVEWTQGGVRRSASGCTRTEALGRARLAAGESE